MYRIICEKTNEYAHLNPTIVDFLEIMNSYQQGILIFEHSNQTVFVNDIATTFFHTTTNPSVINSFIMVLGLEQHLEKVTQKIIRFEPLKKRITTSLKPIREKGEVKYTICVLEEMEALMDVVDKEKTPLHSPTIKAESDILSDVIGESPMMENLKNVMRKTAKSDSTILLMGATGTGKELFAKTIHRLSPRWEKAFVAINCGAIPDTLIESELFGYEKGAFTGAGQKGKIGKVEQAHGGTLFLDEIENMSVYLQMKLLRVLEDRTIVRVGGLDEISVDMRVLAATNSDLKEMVEQGRFRRDLYYRLNIIKFDIPTLSERENDILLLSDHFIKGFAYKMKRPIRGLSEDVKELFLARHWDGNVRELRNVIEYAMNFEETDEIQKKSLPQSFFKKENQPHKQPTFKTIAELEREEIARALDYFGWDDKGKQQVAKVLDISRSSIYRKMNK